MRRFLAMVVLVVGTAGCGSGSGGMASLPTYRPDIERYIANTFVPSMPASQQACVLHQFSDLSAAALREYAHRLQTKDQQAMDVLGEAAAACAFGQ